MERGGGDFQTDAEEERKKVNLSQKKGKVR